MILLTMLGITLSGCKFFSPNAVRPIRIQEGQAIEIAEDIKIKVWEKIDDDTKRLAIIEAKSGWFVGRLSKKKPKGK